MYTRRVRRVSIKRFKLSDHATGHKAFDGTVHFSASGCETPLRFRKLWFRPSRPLFGRSRGDETTR